jgi:hypothetical protein
MDDWEEMKREMDANYEAMEKRDKQAFEKGRMVGRYIQHQFADGYAYYQIVKENKNSVRIDVITGLGDDWVLPAWGRSITISKKQAMGFLAGQDAMRRIFEGRG